MYRDIFKFPYPGSLSELKTTTQTLKYTPEVIEANIFYCNKKEAVDETWEGYRAFLKQDGLRTIETHSWTLSNGSKATAKDKKAFISELTMCGIKEENIRDVT